MAQFSMSKVIDVLGAARDAQRNRSECVRIAVRIGSAAPRPLVMAVKEILVPEDRGAEVDVRLAGSGPDGRAHADLAVILCGASESDAARSALAFLRDGTPVALLAESAVEVPDLDLPEGAEDYVTVIACSDPDDLASRLALWFISSCRKDLSLAANFPFCRSAAVGLLVQRCAAENAAVGAIQLIPGSDMPIMTANQAKLALEIAAAYGRELEPARLLEIAAVVGAGFAWRSVSRSVTRLLPSGGWVLRGVLGYVGTLAVGKGLELRFDIEDGNVEFSLPKVPTVSFGDGPLTASLGLPVVAAQAARESVSEAPAKTESTAEEYVIIGRGATVGEGA